MTTVYRRPFLQFFLHSLPRVIGSAALLSLAFCSALLSGLSPDALSKRRLKPGEGLIVGSFAIPVPADVYQPSARRLDERIKPRLYDLGWKRAG